MPQQAVQNDQTNLKKPTQVSVGVKQRGEDEHDSLAMWGGHLTDANFTGHTKCTAELSRSYLNCSLCPCIVVDRKK